MSSSWSYFKLSLFLLIVRKSSSYLLLCCLFFDDLGIKNFFLRLWLLLLLSDLTEFLGRFTLNFFLFLDPMIEPVPLALNQIDYLNKVRLFLKFLLKVILIKFIDFGCVAEALT